MFLLFRFLHLLARIDGFCAARGEVHKLFLLGGSEQGFAVHIKVLPSALSLELPFKIGMNGKYIFTSDYFDHFIMVLLLYQNCFGLQFCNDAGLLSYLALKILLLPLEFLHFVIDPFIGVIGGCTSKQGQALVLLCRFLATRFISVHVFLVFPEEYGVGGWFLFGHKGMLVGVAGIVVVFLICLYF